MSDDLDDMSRAIEAGDDPVDVLGPIARHEPPVEPAEPGLDRLTMTHTDALALRDAAYATGRQDEAKVWEQRRGIEAWEARVLTEPGAAGEVAEVEAELRTAVTDHEWAVRCYHAAGRGIGLDSTWSTADVAHVMQFLSPLIDRERADGRSRALAEATEAVKALDGWSDWVEGIGRIEVLPLEDVLAALAAIGGAGPEKQQQEEETQ